MTFDDYIKNPMGDKVAVMSNREIYRAMYKAKYEAIMVRENGKVNYKVYKDKRKHTYYLHILVPSEAISKFYYDVVIKFIPSKTSDIEGSIKNYDVQFYSNDPSFVYTFAHAFMKEDLFIKELSSRMSREAITKRPVEKNPKEEIAYVKSLYFAYLIMKDKSLFAKVILDPAAIPYDEKGLISTITHADKKIEDRQNAAADKRAEQRKEKAKREEEIKQDLRHIGGIATDSNKKTSNISMTKTTKTMSNISVTKKTKKVKTISRK